MIKSNMGSVSMVGATNVITMDLAMVIKSIRNNVTRKQGAAVADMVVNGAIAISKLDGEELEGAIKLLMGDPELEVIAIKDDKKPVDNDVDMAAMNLWNNMMDEMKKLLEGR